MKKNSLYSLRMFLQWFRDRLAAAEEEGHTSRVSLLCSRELELCLDYGGFTAGLRVAALNDNLSRILWYEKLNCRPAVKPPPCFEQVRWAWFFETLCSHGRSSTILGVLQRTSADKMPINVASYLVRGNKMAAWNKWRLGLGGDKLETFYYFSYLEARRIGSTLFMTLVKENCRDIERLCPEIN